MKFIIRQKTYRRIYLYFNKINANVLNEDNFNKIKFNYAVYEKYSEDNYMYILYNVIYPIISDNIIRDDIIIEFETTQPLYDMCTKVEINNEEHVITGIKRLASDEVIFYIEDKIIEDEITKESYDRAKFGFDKHDTGESICFMDYEQYEKHIKERNGELSKNKENIKN